MKGKDDKDRSSFFSNLQETLAAKRWGVVRDSVTDQIWAPASVNHHTCSCHVGWRERGAQAGGRGTHQGASSSLENVAQGSLLAFGLLHSFLLFSVLPTAWENLSSSTGDSPPHSSHTQFSSASGNQPQPSSCPQNQVPSVPRKPTSWLLSSPIKFHHFQITWMIPHWKMHIKTTMRYQITLVRTVTIIKKSTNNKYWRRCGEKGTCLYCWWECKPYNHYGEQNGDSFKN